MLSMDYRFIAKRLVKLNDQITDSERSAGLAWYYRAYDIVTGLADEYEINRDVVAAVIAALSPNVRWSTNVKAARTMIDHWYYGGLIAPPVPGYPANRKKAWNILQTGWTGHLKGPKVEAFAANLRGDLEFVTLDMWAIRAIGGDPERISAEVRHNAVLGYKHAAHIVGMSPAEFQAVVWVHVRGGAE